VLKRDSAGFKVNHLGRVSITHWPKEGEPELIIDENGKMRLKFLERQMNLSFKAKKDDRIQRKIKSEKIPKELKKGMPSEERKQSRSLQRSLKTS
jgi:formylmethanofuran dehydrogenase subunit E